MGMITKYGTQWGQIPQTAGRVFFVGTASSSVSTVTIEGRTYPMSDGNDGLSPERPLATISQAISNATANAGDVIALLPGTHNASSMTGATASGALAFSKAGITVVGLPYDPSRPNLGVTPQAIITAPASTVAAVCTAANLTFLNVGFLGVSGVKSVSYTTACNSLTFKGCFFDLTVGAASTAGIAGTGATQTPTGMFIDDCMFVVDNTGTSGSFALDVSAAKWFLVRSSRFRFPAQGAGVAAHTAMIKVNAGAVGTFEDNKITAELSATATITGGVSGVTMTANGSIHLIRNIVSAVVTSPFTGFAAGDADLALNYIGTVAGGTGGTLITSTT